MSTFVIHSFREMKVVDVMALCMLMVNMSIMAMRRCCMHVHIDGLGQKRGDSRSQGKQ